MISSLKNFSELTGKEIIITVYAYGKFAGQKTPKFMWSGH